MRLQGRAWCAGEAALWAYNGAGLACFQTREIVTQGWQGANRAAITGGSGYAGQVHDGGYPGSETASWDGAWCSFEHGGVSTLEQSRRLALHAPWESAGNGNSPAGTTERDR